MKSFSYKRARAIFLKEFKHIFRDPFTLMMALLLPLAIVLILGNSMEFNIKSISMAYLDHDRTQSSRKLVETFASSDYFKPYTVESPAAGEADIRREKARMFLFIPPDFEKEIMAGRKGKVQILLDGADNSTISAVMNYLNTINMNAIYKIKDIPVSKDSLLDFRYRYLYNPELNSQWFSIPGIAAVIIALVAMMLTTLTICREWETGSMEMLLSTPSTALEIMIGKLFPYAFLSFGGFIVVFFCAQIIFGVPFVGSYFNIILGTLLFIIGYLATGMFISVVSRKQEVAVQYAATIGLLPLSLLSGFIFPIEYMPDIYQWIASVFPARFYMELSRDQFLKGSSFTDLWFLFFVLGMQALVWIAACVLKFKRSIE